MPEEAVRIRDFILRTAQFAWTKTSRPGYRISDDWADPIDFHNDQMAQSSGVDLLVSALLVSKIKGGPEDLLSHTVL